MIDVRSGIYFLNTSPVYGILSTYRPTLSDTCQGVPSHIEHEQKAIRPPAPPPPLHSVLLHLGCCVCAVVALDLLLLLHHKEQGIRNLRFGAGAGCLVLVTEIQKAKLRLRGLVQVCGLYYLHLGAKAVLRT